MEAIFLKILNMSITAGWIVLAVVLLRFLLRKAPKWISCMLWVLVAIRLVLPFSIESVLSLIPSKETIPPEIITSPAPTIHSGIEYFNSTVNPVISDVLAPDPVKGTTPVVTIVGIATLVWIVGILAMLIYSVVSYLRIRRRIKVSIETEKGIFICDSINTPFILGLIKPKIYLPSTLSQEDAQYVLAHERAHLKRHDHLIKPFGFLLLSIYWFNPLLWLGYILLCRDIELACDEKVMKGSSIESKKSYSTALLNCSIPRRMISACPLAFGEVGVKKRIKNILNYKKPAFWIIIVALIVSIVASVCFLTNPVSKETDIDITDETISFDIKATEMVYNNPVYSYIQEVEDTPVYRVVKGRQLQEITFSEAENKETAKFVGDIEFYELDEYTFDSRFQTKECWDKGYSPSILKESNKSVLYTEDNENYYQILQQKDGSCYLIIGSIYTDHTVARWVYKAEITASQASDIALRSTSTGNDYLLYTYVDENSPLKSAYIKLYPENKRFEFSISPLSSYFPTGTYTTEGNNLILTTDSGYLSTYVFDVFDSYNLEFVESKSSPLPKFKYSASDKEATPPFEDGAFFGWSESSLSNKDDIVNYALAHSIDSILFDIDGDGEEEHLVIAEEPSSDYSYTLVVLRAESGATRHNLTNYTVSDAKYYRQYIAYSSCDFKFTESNNTLSLEIKESNSTELYEVMNIKGSIVISKDGDEFGYYDTYARVDIDSDGIEEDLIITSVYDTSWSPAIYYLTVFENGEEEYVGGFSEDKEIKSIHLERAAGNSDTIFLYTKLSNEISTEHTVYRISVMDGQIQLIGSTIYDSIYFDIDNDGIVEELEISHGQTSGLFTFRISVSDYGLLEYSNSFQSEWYSLNFEVTDDKLYVVGHTQDNPSQTHKYEIYIENGNIVLERNGAKLPYHNTISDQMFVL